MYKRSIIPIGDEKFPIISSYGQKGKPILLVCGGGPGIPQYILEYLYPSVLDEYFNVVYFDYRGTGLFPRRKHSSCEMTTERYLNDIKNLVEYFISIVPENQIYIMGHSFGSYMALLTVKRHPEFFRAYISMSQICNQYLSECIAVEYMRSCYTNKNKNKRAARFDKYDIVNNETEYHKYVISPLRDSSMHELGIGTTRYMKSPIKGLFFPSLKCPMYSISERVRIWIRKFGVASYPVVSDAMRFNAFSSVTKIEVPIYFITGRHDYTCNAELQISYYENIEAPHKELFIFEDSAHSPIYECPDESKRILSTILRE